MKLLIVLGAITLFLAFSLVGSSTLSAALVSDIPVESKEQPTKEVILGSDSKSPKWKEVPFDHVTHSVKNYSRDGKSVIACVECHHTDEPEAEAKKNPLHKTGQRDQILTTEVLAKADAKPVLSCRACHAQKDEKPARWPANPVVNIDGTDVTEDNEKAYHRNCIDCHKYVKENRPDTIKNAPTACGACHKTAS